MQNCLNNQNLVLKEQLIGRNINKKFQQKDKTNTFFLIGPRFHRVNRLFVLSFENEGNRKVSTGYYLLIVEIKDYNIMIDGKNQPVKIVEIKDYNVMVDGKNLFDQPVKSDTRTYDNIWRIATGQGDDHATGCLLDYNYFSKHKMIAIDLIKQQALDADADNLILVEMWMFFIIEEPKEIILDFSKGTEYFNIVIQFFFNIISI